MRNASESREIESFRTGEANGCKKSIGFFFFFLNENPLAYVAGAFVGGVIVGYVMGRGKS